MRLSYAYNTGLQSNSIVLISDILLNNEQALVLNKFKLFSLVNNKGCRAPPGNYFLTGISRTEILCIENDFLCKQDGKYIVPRSIFIQIYASRLRLVVIEKAVKFVKRKK